MAAKAGATCSLTFFIKGGGGVCSASAEQEKGGATCHSCQQKHTRDSSMCLAEGFGDPGFRGSPKYQILCGCVVGSLGFIRFLEIPLDPQKVKHFAEGSTSTKSWGDSHVSALLCTNINQYRHLWKRVCYETPSTKLPQVHGRYSPNVPCRTDSIG